MHTLRKKCVCPRAYAAVSTKSVAWRCSLKKFVQIQVSSWRGRRCGVVQALCDHLRWCRPHPVCLWFALETWPRGLPHQKFYFRHFSRKFCTTLVTLILKLFFPDQCPLSRWVLDPLSPNFEPRSRENIFQGVQVLHYFIFFFCFSFLPPPKAVPIRIQTQNVFLWK